VDAREVVHLRERRSSLADRRPLEPLLVGVELSDQLGDVIVVSSSTGLVPSTGGMRRRFTLPVSPVPSAMSRSEDCHRFVSTQALPTVGRLGSF
jgi:hypothetical protein